MPEYLAPGVYVEEAVVRARSIEGVSTSTAAFVGPTRKGPWRTDEDTGDAPQLLTSIGEFHRLYGGFSDLSLGSGAPGTNHMAHAVHAFFNEGGSRLYVSRVVGANAIPAMVDVVPGTDHGVRFIARFPGVAGNGAVVVREHALAASAATLTSAPPGSLVRARVGGNLTMLVNVGARWRAAAHLEGAEVPQTDVLAGSPEMLTVSVRTVDGDDQLVDIENMGLHDTHPHWIGHVMAAAPSLRDDHLHKLYAIQIGADVSAADLYTGLFHGASPNAAGQLERVWVLSGGQDGGRPTPADYERALSDIALLEDVSIVAAPGSSAHGADEGHPDNPQAIAHVLIAHAQAHRAFRMAVLDTPPRLQAGAALGYRGLFDSSHAAIYYPWVIALNPQTHQEIALPPSGFVCGVYARNDVERGVHKAPANEEVRGALRFEFDVNLPQHNMLNPAGVNCLRHMAGLGNLVWGARLVSSDPEWKYVNQRRYFNYLEAAIDRGTQWVTLEPNGEPLWARIRQTIADHLYNEWRNGALPGHSPEQAFFVRCDRSTMTQSDRDNGRVVCLIGVALIKPAEFVILRMGRKTADALG